MSRIFATVFLLSAILIPGCGGPNYTVGGDSPVTTNRLEGARLAHIKGAVSWHFLDRVAIVPDKFETIPVEIAAELLGTERECQRITADWKLDESAGKLELTNVEIDDSPVDTNVTIGIRPAGHVRANIGSRQYNIMRGEAKDTGAVPLATSPETNP